MASIESQDEKRICGTNKDIISNMPDLVIQKIIKRLPVTMVVNMGAVSRLWRENSLSHQCLDFCSDFWTRHNMNWERGSRTISGILFHHHGPIRTFRLFIPFAEANRNLILGQWVSFLSRSCVKKIALENVFVDPDNIGIVPSYIFHCRELVKLDLCSITLNPPPIYFQGFAHLKTLQLTFVTIRQNMLSSLITNCPCLVFLKVDHCDGVTHLAVDAPCLEQLFITGYAPIFQTLCLKNVPSLTEVSFSLSTMANEQVTDGSIAAIKSLSSSCKLQSLTLEEDYCKFLAAAGIRNSLPKAFNHLQRLCFMRLNLSNSDVLCCTLGMLQSCPCIRDLQISLVSTGNTSQHEDFQYDRESCKLPYLLKMTVTGIVGLVAELKLVEYVLDVSVCLEKFFFKFGRLDVNAELKVLSELNRFTIASTKTQLVRLG